MRQNQAKLFYENNAKSYKTYIITYFDSPECIKVSPKLPKTHIFREVLPLDPTMGPKGDLWTPCWFDKDCTKIRTPWMLNPGNAHTMTLTSKAKPQNSRFSVHMILAYKEGNDISSMQIKFQDYTKKKTFFFF